MNSQWNSFIEGQQSALCHNTQQLERLAEQPVLAELGHYGFLQVQGPDAQKFMQGQLTCHLNEVGPEQTRLGAQCNPQGRMLTSFRLGQWADQCYWLRMRKDILDRTQQGLAKYAVFFKAKMEQPEAVALGLAGAGSQQLLQRVLGTAPSGRDGCVALPQGGLALQLDDTGERFELWLPADRAVAVWQSLASGATPASRTLWQLLAIQAGLGELEASTVELFIPQMINLQAVGGIHFKKGCYTGQEIVARMQYLGKLKRHMYRVEIATAHCPAAGARLLGPEGEQAVGEIVNAVQTDPQRVEALAVITDSALENGVHLENNQGPTLQILPLPYTW